MINGEDPTARRRLDREAQNERDADVWRRRHNGQSFRQIAHALAMPASSVQRCYQRAAKRAQKMTQALNDELDAVLARYDDGGMTAEDVRIPEDVGRCNELERYRLRHFPDDSPQRRALAGWVCRSFRDSQKSTWTNHGQARTNTYHHPEKLLRADEDDDGP